MKTINTADFVKQLTDFPAEIQKLWLVQQIRFRHTWRDPRLHIKKVGGLEGVFSLRITRRYRALFYFTNTETAVFFDIDHRKDVYK